MNSSKLSSQNSHSTNTQKNSKEPCVKIIPLGGLHEIGKNTCVFEYGDDLILIDGLSLIHI